MDFAWWCLWERESPSLLERLDIQIGHLCSFIANANRGKDQKVLSFKDCMIRFDEAVEKPVQDVRSLKSRFAAATALMHRGRK